jgi:FkbM family methyltransferase
VPAFSLCDLFPDIPVVTVVDIGAMMLNNEISCAQGLVDRGKARMIGFEPNQEECAKVNAALGAPHQFFPYFVGNGEDRFFYETNYPMTGSLYPPNTDLLDRYQNLGELTRLVATHPVKTTRLDDISDISDIDLLKMDVQGAEVDVIHGAENALKSVSIIQTEVCFVELYQGQYLFADVDRELRARGFSFHTFLGFGGRALKPLISSGNINQQFRQLLWSDAIYIKDIAHASEYETDKLFKLALILHDEYNSFDFCNYILKEIDRRNGSDCSGAYIKRLTGA